MFLDLYVLRVEGARNNIFAVIPKIGYEGRIFTDLDQEIILIPIHHKRGSSWDSEKELPYNGLHGKEQLRIQQKILKPDNLPHFPVHMEGYQIFDAFICNGLRFGYTDVGVLVVVCEQMENNKPVSMWANIYDTFLGLDKPTMILRCEEAQVEIDDFELVRNMLEQRSAQIK